MIHKTISGIITAVFAFAFIMIPPMTPPDGPGPDPNNISHPHNHPAPEGCAENPRRCAYQIKHRVCRILHSQNMYVPFCQYRD